MAVVPVTSAVTTEEIGRFVWPAGIDPASCDTFRDPPPGRACDPAEIPLQELVVLARRYLGQGSTEDAVLIAMRDACRLQRLRETSRNRCLEALALARN